MQAKDVMTRSVISVDPNATIVHAARVMLQHHISGLPVINEKHQLVGILSEGDFLRRRETGTERQRPRWLQFLIGPGRIAEEYTHSHGATVSEVMTSQVLTVGEDASLEEVVELMERHRIKRVPVMRDHKVVGIISRANIMHGMVSLARGAPAASLDDTAIRDRLITEIQREQWAPAAITNVVVRDGVVDLWGLIVDERQRNALKVAAENIPGVKAVKDHLVWIEPMSGTTLGPPADAALGS